MALSQGPFYFTQSLRKKRLRRQNMVPHMDMLCWLSFVIVWVQIKNSKHSFILKNKQTSKYRYVYMHMYL